MPRVLGLLSLALAALGGGVALWVAGADEPWMRIVAGLLGLVVVVALGNLREPASELGNELVRVRELALRRRSTYDPQTDPRVLKSIKRQQEKRAKSGAHGAASTPDAPACLRCGRVLQGTDAGGETRVVLLTPGQRFGLRCGACTRVFCNECLAGATGGGAPEVRHLSLACPECPGRLEVVGAG